MTTIEEKITAAISAKEHGDYTEAERLANEILAETSEANERAKAKNLLGNIGLERGNYALALEFFTEVLELSAGDKAMTATAISNIGLVYWYLSDFARALEYHQNALSLEEELGQKSGVARVTGNIGNVYMELSDYARALEYFQKALSVYEELGSKSGVASWTGNIGIVYRNLSDYARALEYYQKALSIYEELGSKSGVAANTGNIGNVYKELSDYARALEYFQKALSVYEELGSKSGVAANTGNIGIVYAKEEFDGYDPEKAEEFLLKSLAIFTEIGAKNYLYTNHKDLAELYEKQERWKEHSYHFKKYHELKEEVQSDEARKKAEQIEREKQLAVERADAEATNRALQKFLPDAIISMAKSGKLVVEKFDSVAILFADLVGFTPLSTKIPPTVMIELLNFVFTHFDSIVKKHGGHRLRTMGDGYFAIVGVPDRIENPTLRMAKIALKMQEDFILPKEISQYLPEKTEFEVRIGLNCGEAVCGLVGGGNRWQYDAYGDAINTAARMESHGEAGKIHCTEEFVKNLTQTLSEGEGLKIIPLSFGEGQGVRFIPRGEIEVKGKGKMRTYFLEKLG